MKTLSLALAIVMGAASLPAAEPAGKTITVEVPQANSVDLLVPAGWKLEKIQPVATRPPTLKLQTKNADVSLQITLIPDPDGKFAAQEKVEQAVSQLGLQYAAGSVEKETKVKDLKSSAGPSAIAEFTDADLVDKPSKPGSYKVVGAGIIQVGNIAAAFTVMGDSYKHESYKAAKQVLVGGLSVHKADK